MKKLIMIVIAAGSLVGFGGSLCNEPKACAFGY